MESAYSRILCICTRVLTLPGAAILFLFLHLAATPASGTPLIFFGQVICNGMVMEHCDVDVTFYFKDDQDELIKQKVQSTTTNSNGLFAVRIQDPETEGDFPITWFATVSVNCPCYQKKEETFPLEFGLDPDSIADIIGKEALLELVKTIYHVESVPVLLSTEFVALKGAAVIQVDPIPGCTPEPATFLLVGAASFFIPWAWRRRRGLAL
jgi:PEP-CTERM motif